ncbi:MAG: hypothetical protein GXP31_19440 [Kiritimatiellaeota bacterium]|nr:hypothetical protein [Kiritimatiellota bacterium]
MGAAEKPGRAGDVPETVVCGRIERDRGDRMAFPFRLTIAVLGATLAAAGLEVRVNREPIYTAPPRQIRSAPNGLLAEVGKGPDRVFVLHLWGTPYEMGRAQGVLLKKQIVEGLPAVIEAMGRKMGGDLGKLDRTAETTRRFWPPHFEPEMRGLADGAGIGFESVVRANMIGETSEWHCSLFAASGPATRDGRLLQLRALDYETRAGIQRFPVITVYHPDRGHPFANFGWAGIVGSVTGMSSVPLAISEIGDDYDAMHDSLQGTPFMFLLRDILQFDTSLEAALRRIRRARRTTSLLYAVGDGKSGEFRAVQASRTVFNVYSPEDLEPLTPTHPRIPNIVYWGMSWDVPKYDKRLHDMLVKHYGKLTPELTVREILPTVGTGNLQVAVYDLTNQIVWTANAAAVEHGEPPPLAAYDRPYIRLDMRSLFRVRRPGD